MDSVELNDIVALKYSIHKYSSYSSKFRPENILIDKPEDQSSRWSSNTYVPPQYLVLKLDSLAVVTSITFGKYGKSHVCNIKKLQVWGGLAEDHFMLLFDGGLKNDSNPETFPLKHKADSAPFPIRYIKLLPLQTWGSTFNFSIWHVSVSGCVNHDIVQRCIHTYNLHTEREALRVCLKHLRHRRYNGALAALTQETSTPLEHPLLTRLYEACTAEDDTQLVEEIFRRAVDAGLMTEYIRGLPLVPLWRQLLPPHGAPPNSTPGMRGGHQLCCDSTTQSIYLFGGWDGQQDLSDFWVYSIPTNEWTCISPDTRLQGGPSPRSCHKMCLDSERRQMFMLGRYIDSKLRAPENLKSDFYLYELDTGRWTLISEDTGGVGGPRLIFDHQIVMDTQNRVIYVFGGRVLTTSRWENVLLGNGSVAPPGASAPPPPPRSSQEYTLSGLYRYHVATNSWTLLREDELDKNFFGQPLPNQPQPTGPTLKARIGHSMLFNPVTRQLFILAGQRYREYLTDFFTYQVDTDTVNCISDPTTHWITPNGSARTHYPRRNANDPAAPAAAAAASVPPPTGGAGSGAGSSGGTAPHHRGMAMSAVARAAGVITGPGGIFEGNLPTGVPGFPYKLGTIPTAGFTQKATIDPLLEEIHVLSGLSKEKEKRDLVCNSFWVYSIPRNRWLCIYHSEATGDGQETDGEPCPRYAHQLVYDHINKVHYMFGGNPGRSYQAKMRLDDFWALQLSRTTKEKLLNEAIFAIRKNRFEELAVEDTSRAMSYLQSSLNDAVDHSDKAQVEEFQRLASKLFKPADPILCHPPPISSLPQPQHRHIEGFEDLLGPSPATVGPSLSCNSDTSMDDLSATAPQPGASSSSSSTRVHPPPGPGDSAPKDETKEQFEAWKHQRRSELFSYLSKYFPDDMTQPKLNLEDLVSL